MDVRFQGAEKRYPPSQPPRRAMFGRRPPVTPTRPALAALDLTIESGALAVLVGPSGCGKSTTLRLVAGLEQPSSGRVFLGDRDVTDVPPAKRDVAMVFQSYALYPHMSVRDNLAFALVLRKMTRADIDARVQVAARSLGLEPYLDRRPSALSGGQRQRVAIGRALVRDPSVFLFDEPLSNLDAVLRGEMRREIARIHRETGTTCLYVTHDQVEAMTLADVIVVLKDGEVQQVGSPKEVYQKPANRFVAGFFGSPAMCFVRGQLEDSGQTQWARGPGFEIPVAKRTSGSREVLLGARPETLTLDKRPGTFALAGTVELVEVLGANAIVRVASSAGELAVVTEADRQTRPGESVTVWMDPGSVHVFDSQTEQRL